MPLPAGDTYLFRTSYVPVALHEAGRAVAARYPDKPVRTIMNGDSKGKDTFSLRCVNAQAALGEGVDPPNLVPYLTSKNPVTRRDIRPDDIAPSRSIHFTKYWNSPNPTDEAQLDVLLAGEPDHNSLSFKAAQQAKLFLGVYGEPVNGRAKLPDNVLTLFGDFEQVDIAKPLEAHQKNKIPSVHSTQCIWHQLNPFQQQQFAQNLQDTQAQGSYLVVGANEVGTELSHLPDLLQRHGYTPDVQANTRLKERTENNRGLSHLSQPGVKNYVYLKEGL